MKFDIKVLIYKTPNFLIDNSRLFFLILLHDAIIIARIIAYHIDELRKLELYFNGEGVCDVDHWTNQLVVIRQEVVVQSLCVWVSWASWKHRRNVSQNYRGNLSYWTKFPHITMLIVFIQQRLKVRLTGNWIEYNLMPNLHYVTQLYTVVINYYDISLKVINFYNLTREMCHLRLELDH